MSRYIRFNKYTEEDRWIVSNKKHRYRLGFIEDYRPWKQFIFVPQQWLLNDTIFCAECLEDIAEFLKGVNRKKVVDKAKDGRK